MNPRSSLVALAALSLLPALPSAAQAQQSSATFTASVTRQLSLNYLVQLPEGYDAPENAGKKWPLVVFLHGAGERGSDLSVLKKHGPPKLIEAGRRFPAVVISPQCPADSWWTDQPVLELVDHAEKTYRLDPARLYLTGLSMGGYGTWHFASQAPDRFAAIVPICGGGVPYHMRKLGKLPVWAFHGEKDTVVPPEESVRLIKALEKAGNTAVKYTAYPEAGHDSWTPAYDTAELWDWLFAQQRQP